MRRTTQPRQRGLGEKVIGYVETAAQAAGALKGVWEAGKMLYDGGRAAYAVAQPLLLAAL